jgi:hypothetical protein
VGGVHRQSGLADPGHPVDRGDHHHPGTGTPGIPAGQGQLAELAPALGLGWRNGGAAAWAAGSAESGGKCG